MFDEDFIRTRKNNNNGSSDATINNDTNIEFNDTAHQESNEQVHRYKAVISRFSKASKTKRSLIQKIPPPPHRLSFMNAVNTAWLLQTRRLQRPKLKRTRYHRAMRKEYKVGYPYSPKTIELPPITSVTLAELSVPQLFSCLQIRHDLLMDPNLSFRPNLTPQKCREAEIYWSQLDQLIQQLPLACGEFLHRMRPLLKELAAILISLISPFPKLPSASVVWHWPAHISEQDILATLDPDLAHQQLIQGCFNIHSKFDFALSIISQLCPARAEKIFAFVQEQKFARALEEIFLTLETIKLDVANKALHYYRPYLMETCASLEWSLFLKQISVGEIDTISVSEWLLTTWHRLGFQTKFMEVLHTGIVNMVTDDQDTIEALHLIPSQFPITFRYDQKRLKTQLRHEFQNIIVIALLLIPYRLMAGKHARAKDITHLKTVYSRLLKDASMSSGKISCFHLALHACSIAKKANMIQDDLVELARYWSNWMQQNLRNASPVYRVMYDRVRSKLIEGLNQGSMQSSQLHAIIGLEPEISKLGNKLIVLAGHNKRTFKQLYNVIANAIRRNVIRHL